MSEMFRREAIHIRRSSGIDGFIAFMTSVVVVGGSI